MPLQSFIDNSLPTIKAAWLNLVDGLMFTIFDSAATKAAARTALTSDAPMSVAQGGTGATAAAAARTNLDAVGLTGNETIAGNKTFSGVIQGLFDISSATGGQIKFPATQNPSADVNTLDDYEEGTWTPSVGGTATYLTQSGTYTKIGRRVFVKCQLSINAIGTGSTTVISGLPFAANAHRYALSISNFIDIATSVVFLAAYVDASASTITFVSMTVAANATSGNAIFGNLTAIQLSGSYDT